MNTRSSRWRAIDRVTGSPFGAALLLGLLVFAACLVGIYTRPVGFLATVWPANAIMLGLVIRRPAMAKPLGWVAAALAFVAADLLTGASLLKAVLLNSANLVSVGTAFFVYKRLPPGMARLRHPSSMLYLVLASAAAGTTAGIVGGIVDPLLFEGSFIGGWTLWCATEFANYIAILPVLLSTPRLRTILSGRLRPFARRGWRGALPLAALLLSCLGALIIGGPGAIAFPVPALLWCGLTFSVFETALLTLLFGVWTLVVIASGYLPGAGLAGDEMMLVSVRLGVSLIALAPVMLASVMQSRNTLLGKLHHLATHDNLTGASSRNAFLQEAARELAGGARPIAVLMLDLDHFKTVNDSFGHAAGDEVLVAFARRMRRCLRPKDLFGRLGGEEFAVAVYDCTEAEVVGIAERIRLTVAATPVTLADGRPVAISASIGMVIALGGAASGIDPLLADADALLYTAKHKGRDRIEILVKDNHPRAPEPTPQPTTGPLSTQPS